MDIVRGRRSVKGNPSTLVNKNITIDGRRTSVRLEQLMWDALNEIARRERLTVHEVCEKVDGSRSESSLTAGIRVYIVSYYRAASTEDGHAASGHGRL